MMDLHKEAFTGCYDMHGNPIYEGQFIRHNNNHKGTKREYWLPIYKVIFRAPCFTLEHAGGGKDGGSHEFILRCGGGSKCIEIVASPEENGAELDRIKKAGQRLAEVLDWYGDQMCEGYCGRTNGDAVSSAEVCAGCPARRARAVWDETVKEVGNP